MKLYKRDCDQTTEEGKWKSYFEAEFFKILNITYVEFIT